MKIGDYFLIINDAKAEFLIVRLQYFVIDALQRHNDYVVTLHVIISMSIIMADSVYFLLQNNVRR